MRKFGLIALIMVYAASLFAVPARRGWMPRVLADGSVVEVQQIGDEYYHYMVTRDGKIVKGTPEGLVISDEPLPTPEQIRTRRMASPLMAGRERRVGSVNLAPRGLLILVNFSDVAFQPENSQAAMDSMMNSSGYSFNGATGSARDYFIAQSDSQYMPIFDVVGPVTLSNTRKYYGENVDSVPGADRRYFQIAIDACQAVDDIVDFSVYDNDSNGDIDFVYIIYADKGEADGGPEEAIWPHNYYVKDYAHKYVKLDGKYLNNYACSGELLGYSGARNTIGTPCHEFGHVIGLPDYYDTTQNPDGSGGYNYNNYLTPNEWTIMDYGCYNNRGNTPPNYSIFDKYFLGWATPKVLPADAQLNVTLTTDYDDAYQITGGTSLLPYYTTKTVYYIENRQKQGWDAYLNGHGMLVWQVKYNDAAWSSNTSNNSAGKPRYTLIAADGSSMIGYCYEYNEQREDYDILHKSDTDPFPGAAKITAWDAVTGCALSDITETGGIIRFKFNGGKTTCTYEIMAEHCIVPEDSVLALGDTLSLIILPEEGYRLDDPDCWAVEMGEDKPILVYGEGFTYDALTGEFRIENVTDDIVIIVEAKEDTGTGLEDEKLTIKSAKTLRNGQLIIIRGNKHYNAQGIEIQ